MLRYNLVYFLVLLFLIYFSVKDFKNSELTDSKNDLYENNETHTEVNISKISKISNISNIKQDPKYKEYELKMIENRYNPNIRQEVYINPKTENNYTTKRTVNSSEYYIPPKTVKEGFDSSEQKKDSYSYGYLNTFYTELSKEKLEYFVEPLPLQGIDEPPNSSSSETEKECVKLFDYTNKPTNEMKELRERFKKLDKDPLEPFQKLIKDKKLKIKDKRLEKLVKDCAILSLRLKTIYNRGRPYQICYKYGYPIKYLKSKHADTPSYPSSYALQAYSIAFVLGRKYEQYQKEIEKIANDIAWSRVYSGNNFESDIECSKKIVLNLKMYLESVEL